MYRRKTFPMTVHLPCTEGKKKEKRKKTSQWTVRLPCTEGRNLLSEQSVSLVPKEETFSVDSPSPLYRRKKPSQWTVRHPCMEEKKKNKEKTKQNFQLNICTEEKLPEYGTINPPQWTVQTFRSGQSVSLIRKKKEPFSEDSWNPFPVNSPSPLFPYSCTGGGGGGGTTQKKLSG